VLAPEKGTHSASVVVEICNQFESCSRNVIKVQVIDLEPETDVSELIEANIKAENYQTLSNLIAFSSSRSLIKDEVVRVDFFNPIFFTTKSRFLFTMCLFLKVRDIH